MGGADADGVGDLPGIHAHETAETRRDGDASPDIKGEPFWRIAEYAADSIGETAAQLIGQDHGCEEFFSAHIFFFADGKDGGNGVGIVSAATAQIIVAKGMDQKDICQRRISCGSFVAGAQHGGFLIAAP